MNRSLRLAVPLAALALALIAPTGAAAADCAVPGGYGTINAALADNSCTTINVAPGTYNETLDITRSVAIHGASAATTTIAAKSPNPPPNPGDPAQGAVTEVVQVRGAGVAVEISGLTIRYASGFYVPGYPSVPSTGLHVYEDASADVHDSTITEIHNENSNGNQTGLCVVVGNKTPASLGTITLRDNTISYCGKQGITVRPGSTATIDGNTIAHGNQGDGKDPLQNQASNAIVLWANVTATVTNNDIFDWQCPSGTGGAPPNGCYPDLNGVQSVGMYVLGAPVSLEVSGNHIHQTDGAFYADTVGAAAFDFNDNQLDGNLVYNVVLASGDENWAGNTLDGSMYSVVLFGNTSATTLELAGGNVIRNATDWGILSYGSGSDVGVSGSKNSFVNNGAGGIYLTGTSPAELTCNWWGSATGPTVTANPGGSGDATTDNTDWSRFSLNDSLFDCGTIEPTLVFGAASIDEGASTTLSLTLTNSDASPVGPAQVTFALPSGFSATAVESSDCGGGVDISAPGTPAVSAVTLAGNASCTIVLRVTAATAGNFTATIPAGGVIAPSGNSPSAANAAIVVVGKAVPEPPTPPVGPVDPLPACYDKRVIITDVRRTGSRALIRGYARRVEAGKRVTLRSMLSGRTVARPRIAADGSWRADVKAPPRRLWRSNRARYRASLGNSSTIWTKLTRRMGTTSITVSGGKMTVTGSASLPLAHRTRARIQASFDCAAYRGIADLKVSRNGKFSGTLPAPQSNGVFFARVRVRVRNSNGLEYSTYSIVQPVIPR